jgi:hypothetical protein
MEGPLPSGLPDISLLDKEGSKAPDQVTTPICPSSVSLPYQYLQAAPRAARSYQPGADKLPSLNA